MQILGTTDVTDTQAKDLKFGLPSFTGRSWGTTIPLAGDELRKHNICSNISSERIFRREKERQRDRKKLGKKKGTLPHF